MKKVILILAIVLLLFLSLNIVFGYPSKPTISRTILNDQLEVGQSTIIKVTLSNPTNIPFRIHYREHIPHGFHVEWTTPGFTASGADLIYSGDLRSGGSIGGDYKIIANSEGKFNITCICNYSYNGVEDSVTSTDSLIVIENPFKKERESNMVSVYLWRIFHESIIAITMITIVALICFTIVYFLGTQRGRESPKIGKLLGLIVEILLISGLFIFLIESYLMPLLLILLFLGIVVIMIYLILG